MGLILGTTFHLVEVYLFRLWGKGTGFYRGKRKPHSDGQSGAMGC